MQHGPFLYVLAAANLIAMLHLGFYIVGANTYDMKQARRDYKQANKRRGGIRKFPMVSVVIPAHNEATVIRRTLDSVRTSDYENFEIIVVDDGSSDRTASIVRDYIRKHPRLRGRTMIRYNRRADGKLQRRYIRGRIGGQRVLLVSQDNGGKGAAMNNAIAHHVRGELTMCLDADTMLHPQAISRAVEYFRNKKVMGVAANVRIMPSRNWLITLQRFEHLVGYRSKKFYTMTNSEFIIGGVASTYRTKLLKQIGMYDTDTMTEDIGLSMKMIASKGNRKRRIVYAADVLAMTEGVEKFGALLRQRYRWKMGNIQNLYKYRHLIGNQNHKKYSWGLTTYRLPMAILSEILLLMQPLLLTYVIYLCFHYQTYGILLGAYMTLTLYVLWTVWPDEHLASQQKITMSFMSLGMYGLFFVMDVVQLYAAFQVVRNRRSVRHRDLSATWVSPLRSGRLASFSKA